MEEDLRKLAKIYFGISYDRSAKSWQPIKNSGSYNFLQDDLYTYAVSLIQRYTLNKTSSTAKPSNLKKCIDNVLQTTLLRGTIVNMRLSLKAEAGESVAPGSKTGGNLAKDILNTLHKNSKIAPAEYSNLEKTANNFSSKKYDKDIAELEKYFLHKDRLPEKLQLQKEYLDVSNGYPIKMQSYHKNIILSAFGMLEDQSRLVLEFLNTLDIPHKLVFSATYELKDIINLCLATYNNPDKQSAEELFKSFAEKLPTTLDLLGFTIQSTSQQIDISEDIIRKQPELLGILLLDRTKTTKQKPHNILWASASYKDHRPTSEIQIEDITGSNRFVIQPRIVKSKEDQKSRTKDKAEVFTPTKIVKEMNRQIDWEIGNWPTTDQNWRAYVSELRLEITCGEAPFIVNRYNAADGKKVLELSSRVGFLDRKLQTVSKYCNTKKEWLKWATVAFKASYGFEWQGDSLLLARENLFFTFIDYWNDKFPQDEIDLEQKLSKNKLNMLKEIATIISWNIFQMDGLKYVIPMSCKNETVIEALPPLLAQIGEKPKITKIECLGCKTNNPLKHNGKYVKIMDWEKNKPIKFTDLLKTPKSVTVKPRNTNGRSNG